MSCPTRETQAGRILMSIFWIGDIFFRGTDLPKDLVKRFDAILSGLSTLLHYPGTQSFSNRF